VKIVPSKVPKAEEKIDRLKAIITVNGKVGKTASKNGKRTPNNGANQ
jgi:hypothetical protein